MKVLLNSGYSDLDGSLLFVRDSAFDTAAPDDALILWDTEQGYEYGDGTEYTFNKKHLQFVEFDPDYEKADDLYEEVGLSDAPIVNGLVNPPTPADTDISVGDNVLITAVFTVTDVFDGGVRVSYNLEHNDEHSIHLWYAEDTFRDIRVLPKVVHPAVGSLVRINDDDSPYVLASDDRYYSTATPYSMDKHSPDIHKITVIETL